MNQNFKELATAVFNKLLSWMLLITKLTCLG